jgi:hypothetical protein
MLYQNLYYLLVIPCFQKVETGIFFPVYLVVFPVDDTHDPSHRLITTVGQQQDHIAVFEGLIPVGIEILPFIGIEGWDPVGMPFMDSGRQVNEFFHIPPAADRFYNNLHSISDGSEIRPKIILFPDWTTAHPYFLPEVTEFLTVT